MAQQAEQFLQNGTPAPAPARAPVQQHHVSALLKKARQRRRASLDDASHDTRISVTYLSALEAGAPLSAFPAPVYARGFLREYARFLGLDPEQLVDRFWEGESVPDPVTSQSQIGQASRMADRPRGFRGMRRQRNH